VDMPTPDHELGTKLRMMRRMNKMRLKDVADAVDCSESLLSKIENNKVEPSLKVLHRITGDAPAEERAAPPFAGGAVHKNRVRELLAAELERRGTRQGSLCETPSAAHICRR